MQKIAVVGLGYWGPQILRNLFKIPSIHVVGCELDKKKLAKIKLDYPTATYTNSYSEVINDSSLSAVIIATPPALHFPLAKQALLQKKHVLIEKPMTMNTGQAKELVSLAKRKQKILMAGHTFVYTEAVQLMKSYVSKNMLGRLLYYDSTRVNLGLLQKDTNVIWDLAVHDFSILDFLFDEKPTYIQALGSSHVMKNKEELAHIFLSYKSGFIAHIHVSWLSPVKLRTLYLAGNKKMISYNDIEPSEKIKVYEKSIKIKMSAVTPFTPAYRSGQILIPHLSSQEALLTQITHFIRCIKTNSTPITSGESGLRVVKLLEAADVSLKSGKKVRVSL